MESFAVIPVLDLKRGEVVHARAGDRSRYLPIRSKLAAHSSPRAVLDGILSLAPFASVYIADLDAIEGCGGHRAVIADLARDYTGIEFWVDAGAVMLEDALAVAAAGATPVLGSESLGDGALSRASERLGAAGFVLSLDYRGARFLGPAAILEQPQAWPERIIAMTLSRVGRGDGPDVARLAAVERLAKPRRVFAAGGVRGRGDLEELAGMGIAGALVASTLHDGRLTADDMAIFRKG